MNPIIVTPRGPLNADVLFLGEAPGAHESREGKPFVGPSGQYQEACLARRDVSTRNIRFDNVVRLYRPGNPDPNPELLTTWSPVIEAAIAQLKPKLICGIGAYAARWLLGDKADLALCLGQPFPGGVFDPTVAHRANGAAVMVNFHPAYALRAVGAGGDEAVRAITLVQQGYDRIAEAIKVIKAGGTIETRRDEYAGRERYSDVTGKQLARELDRLHTKRVNRLVLGYDTEGVPGDPFSIQVSHTPGTGMMLRWDRPDFAIGAASLQRLVNAGALIVMHCASTPRGTGYDIRMSREMGIDLSRARIFDTMTAAYLLRTEPHGAKALAFRWCGMFMDDFNDLVGEETKSRQVDWLYSVLEHEWAKPETRIEFDNAGVSSLYTPNRVESRVEKMLIAVHADSKDPAECWSKMDAVLSAQVEAICGPMPQPSIRYADLGRVIRYGSRDADAELRMYYALTAELERRGLTDLATRSMAVLPAFELMQSTGMLASRRKVENLRDKLQRDIDKLCRRISRDYYSSQPFNPKSPDDVASLMRRRGLSAAELTPTGKPSTGKKSIEHLRELDEAMAAVADWREMAHVRDTYCNKLLELMSPGDTSAVHCNLKPVNTTARRLASTDPNLLGLPKHEKPGGDYGKQLRDCFVCLPGEVLMEVDQSQVEARVLADHSADPVLCALFNEGRDVHTETAAKMFGIPLKQLKADLKKDKSTEARKRAELMRFLSKKITFGGIMYGQTGMGLAVQLRMMGIKGWSSERCDQLKVDWRKIHKVAAQYISDAESDVMRTGEVRDCWGMPRYLPAVWSGDRRLIAEAKRQAVNHKIQGGAQGLLQNGLAWLYPRIKNRQARGENVQLCLTVHDSLILRLDETLADEVGALVVEALTEHNGLKMRVPCLADIKVASTWGNL